MVERFVHVHILIQGGEVKYIVVFTHEIVQQASCRQHCGGGGGGGGGGGERLNSQSDWSISDSSSLITVTVHV